MTPLRMIGLVGIVFLVSLPMSFFSSDGVPWDFFSTASDRETQKKEAEEDLVDMLLLQALSETGDRNYTKAIATYTKAIQRDPKYAYSYVGRGDAYQLSDNFASAVKDYEQALRLEPDNEAFRERVRDARKKWSAR